MKKRLGLKCLLIVTGLMTMLFLQSVLATVFMNDEEYICWQKPVAEVWIDMGTPDADWTSVDSVFRNKNKWTYTPMRAADLFLHDDGERRLIASKCNSTRETIRRDYNGLRDSCGTISVKEVRSRTSEPTCPEGYDKRGKYCYERGVSPSESEANKSELRCQRGYVLTLKSVYQKWLRDNTTKEAGPRKTPKS